MRNDGFRYLRTVGENKWVIIAPQRAKRPDVAKGAEPVCPFCEGHERLTPSEVFRIGKGRKNKPGWQIRVVPNKFPFALFHEVIIHSPSHQSDFLTYKPSYISKILRVYKARYNFWKEKGQVIIFYNRGKMAGESLPHTHTQLAVVSPEIYLDIPKAAVIENLIHESRFFSVFIPLASQWPAEVWFVPKARGRTFGESSDDELDYLSKLLAQVLKKLVKIYGLDFSFNFYIYHGGDWYLRLIPRTKVIGGFELATGIFVNTSDPKKIARKLSW